MKNLSVKWRGEEVQNPILRVLFIIAIIPAMTALIVICLPLMVVLFFLSLPVHGGLLLFGRKGFVVCEGDTYSYTVGWQGFERRTAVSSGRGTS